MTSNFLVYAGLAFAAGALIPVMAKMNASVAAASGNVSLAATMLLAVGTATAAGTMAFSATEAPNRFSSAPPLYYLAGMVVAFYILTVTFLVPRFGVGNTIIFVVAAQIVSATVIDHFGLLGGAATPLSLARTGGVLLIFGGVYLARS